MKYEFFNYQLNIYCKICFLIGLLILTVFPLRGQDSQTNIPENYNIVWNSQSQNALESMPCGGGDIGMNVWVENGDLLIYLSRSGTFDELNLFPKLGRLRVTLSPNPFNNPNSFLQELKLKEGFVQISASKDGVETTINVWADVFNPVAHIGITSSQKIEVTVSYESWRNEDKILSEAETFACRTYSGAPVKAIAKKDTVKFSEAGVLFYHRNSGETAFDVTVKQQGLESVKSKMWNPLKNLTFGGRLSGENMIVYDKTEGRYASTDYKGWRLKSAKPDNRHNIRVVMHTAHSESEQDWIKELKDIEINIANGAQRAKEKSQKWWSDFWERSYIIINKEKLEPDNEQWQVGRNYQVFRYQLGCNAYGSYPTKFNGGLFTTDPEFVRSNEPFSPDYRAWGGGNSTAQNQRLIYWPMLKSGDIDMMIPQFDFYNNALTNAEIRTHHYWGHRGASFTEQMENFGLPIGFEYGWNRPKDYDPGVEYNAWVEYQWDTSFEFCMMILEAYYYKGIDITKYMPLIESCLRFYDEHYQYRSAKRTPRKLDEQGKLVFYPSTACETYKMTTNPITTITAMKSIIESMLDLPNELLADSTREYITSLYDRVPEGIHYRIKEGKKTFAPAKSWERLQNVELPQLYTVFPWGVHGLGRDELDVARNTWYYGADIPGQKDFKSWHQDAIFCARLGLTEEAAEEIIKKMKDSGRRFPTFWGPGHDWVPDHNWGGSGMIGLQEMLMQTVDNKILLFPAWPKEWDVDFKLHAPKNTIVEAVLKDGEIVKLNVTPKEREKDITIMIN